MSNPRNFAITIPCYKSEATIADTLNAVMTQEALERVACVMIADDHSPDRTVEVARATWKLESPPLQFVHYRKNLGEMVNVNTTVASLPGEVEWFLHMHGDNVPKPGWLKTISNRCLAAPETVGVVCASYDGFFEDGRIESGDDRPGSQPELIKGGVDSVRGTIRKGCWWHNSCGAIRVTTFREVGGFPPGMRQKGDWDFLLRVLNAGWDIDYVPRSLMNYRQHQASASSFAFKQHLDIEESLQVIQKYSPILRISDITVVHMTNASQLLRRFGRSIQTGDLLRARKALSMMVRVFGSCVSCLAAR